MVIRSFQLSDYVQVTQLFQEALTEDCYEQTMEAFARQLSWDSELVLVQYADGEIQGAIIGTIDNNKGCYYRLAVHPDALYKGVGKALTTALQQRFESRKVKGICIAGDEHNQALLPFFAKMGFDASNVLKHFQKLRIVAG